MMLNCLLVLWPFVFKHIKVQTRTRKNRERDFLKKKSDDITRTYIENTRVIIYEGTILLKIRTHTYIIYI